LQVGDAFSSSSSASQPYIRPRPGEEEEERRRSTSPVRKKQQRAKHAPRDRQPGIRIKGDGDERRGEKRGSGTGTLVYPKTA